MYQAARSFVAILQLYGGLQFAGRKIKRACRIDMV
jgi:hypothetical protein